MRSLSVARPMGCLRGAIPTALAAAICTVIYFKVIAKAKAEEAPA